jgi:hypothetical protein
MELEPVEELNKRLVDYYGVAWNGMPIYRIVWSDDQFEMRLTEHDGKGVRLLFPEVRELPKYRHYIQNKYILEKLVELNDAAQNELKKKISYEPLWVYCDKEDNALPPHWIVTQFVIDNVNAAMGQGSLAKYVDKSESMEEKQARVAKIEEELFGNETDVTDALAYGDGVAGFHPNQDMKNKVH